MTRGASGCGELDLATLAERIAVAKERGCTVALANGGFDLLHVGHVRYLRAAAAEADILVVAVNSDRSLRNLKGPGRPVFPQRERVSLLCALEGVDYVVLFEEPTVSQVLLALQPHVHCKGSDYTADTVPEASLVRSYGGRVAIVGGDKVRSTSWLLGSHDQSDSGGPPS